MKLLYLTTVDPQQQLDSLEAMMLHGLRSVLGSSCIDLPRLNPLYGDFSETDKSKLPYQGFSLYTSPIKDVTSRDLKGIDTVLFSCADIGWHVPIEEVRPLCSNIWYLDGFEDFIVRSRPCFKREMHGAGPGTFPTGFGIPAEHIRPLNFDSRTQLFQKSVPAAALFREEATPSRPVFDNEEAYYRDLQSSWFGLTCRDGGWDSLRHYEILAAGGCLLFRDFHKKPALCSPQGMPCFTYSSLDELEALMGRLLQGGKPTDEYVNMVLKQRQWLLQHGTTVARAVELLSVLGRYRVQGDQAVVVESAT